MKKVLSLFLSVVMLICSISMFAVQSVALESTGNVTLDAFINDSRFTDGASWAWNKAPMLASFESQGCCAYCADYVKYCYGINNPRSGSVFYNVSEIRAGDVLTVGNQSNGTGHWFICLKRNGNRLYVAEGNKPTNYVRIGWNYTISGNGFAEESRSFTAGYHYLDAGSGGGSADLGSVFYGVILNTAAWKPISVNKQNGKVTLETEKGVAFQKWRFTRQDDGAYVIESCYNGKALEMTNGNRKVCSQITVHDDYWGGAYQQWYLIPYGEGYIFESKHFTSEGWVMDLYAANHNDGTVIQINNRNNSTAQVWSIYKGNDVQLKAPTLTVQAGNCTTNTTFTWNRIYGSQEYDVKIWKNKVNHDVSSYHTEWGATSGYSIQLPPGTYEAYVTASDYFQIFGSDDVKFTVQDHSWNSPTYIWSSDYSKCTATRVCSRDSSHKETETVNATSVTTQSTYEKTGKIVYTAKFSNSAFSTQKKTFPLPVKTFPDVKDTDWFYTAVQYNAERGFITGFKDGTFGPNKPLTRQDFVVILARIAKADLSSYEGKTGGLKDVAKGSYYASAVAWAVDNEIVTGYANGKFGVGDSITREQVATILYRYMGEPTITATTRNSVLSPYADKGKISSFALNAVAWAVKNGVISGKNATTLAPTATASRAEIATIVMRMDKKGMFNE